ncbi:MAG TPA: hypothetical protein VF038_10890 [Usitatibacter sp.]|jgi:hypothetical protein
MNPGLAQIVGRRICGVVVAESPRAPRQQVFLVFDDGTRFEFWGEWFSCCSGVTKADGLAEYVEMVGGTIVRIHGALGDRGQKRAREIHSRALAIMAIEKAKRGKVP